MANQPLGRKKNTGTGGSGGCIRSLYAQQGRGERRARTAHQQTCREQNGRHSVMQFHIYPSFLLDEKGLQPVRRCVQT